MTTGKKRKWAYILGSIALIGAAFLLRTRAKNLWHRAQTEDVTAMP